MLLSVLAQTGETTTTVKGKAGGASAIFSFLPILLIGVAMYFLMIRPQRRKMRDQQALIRQVEEGDEIITTGGIYGFVTAIDGDVLWVEVDHEKNIEMRIHRSAIARRIDPKVEPAGGVPVVDEAPDADAEASADKKNKK
jgi:preprotein translocase subunit YajC